MALFLADVPISGYFSSSGSPSFFFSAFLFCSIYTMIFVRSGSSDSSSSDNLRASLASASSSSSLPAEAASVAGEAVASASVAVAVAVAVADPGAAAGTALLANMISAAAAAAAAAAVAVAALGLSATAPPPTMMNVLLLRRISWFVFTVSNNISNIIVSGVRTVGRSFCNSSSSSLVSVLPLLCLRVCFSIK